MEKVYGAVKDIRGVYGTGYTGYQGTSASHTVRGGCMCRVYVEGVCAGCMWRVYVVSVRIDMGVHMWMAGTEQDGCWGSAWECTRPVHHT